MKHNSTRQLYAYACGNNSKFCSSYRMGSIRCEPQAPSLSLEKTTCPLYELANIPLDTTLMMNDHIIK